jgi:hypothetical protein
MRWTSAASDGMTGRPYAVHAGTCGRINWCYTYGSQSPAAITNSEKISQPRAFAPVCTSSAPVLIEPGRSGCCTVPLYSTPAGCRAIAGSQPKCLCAAKAVGYSARSHRRTSRRPLKIYDVTERGGFSPWKE